MDTAFLRLQELLHELGLATHNFEICAQHIPKNHNTFIDCLSRWSLSPRFREQFKALSAKLGHSNSHISVESQFLHFKSLNRFFNGRKRKCCNYFAFFYFLSQTLQDARNFRIWIVFPCNFFSCPTCIQSLCTRTLTLTAVIVKCFISSFRLSYNIAPFLVTELTIFRYIASC